MKDPWFAIAMHGEPSLGEHLFCCKLDQLPRVVAGIAAEAPDFRNQLLSLLRMVSHGVDTVNFERPVEGKDSTIPFIDDASAVFIH